MTRTRKGLIAAALVGVLAVPALAAAQGFPRGGRGGGPFAMADANHDGRVSREEGWAWVGGRFTQVDANRDGAVTFDELRAAMQSRSGGRPMRPRAEERLGAMFRSADANSDGRVTLDELRPFADAWFRAHDANGDGIMTREEFRPARAPRGGGRGGTDDMAPTPMTPTIVR